MLNNQEKQPHLRSPTYYAKCMVGGVLSCGLTHTLVVPLDITKCRIQVFPSQYPTLIKSLQHIVSKEGPKALTLGWVPTFIGYSMQGLFKFGLYELFKDFYSQCIKEERAHQLKGPLWLTASASAEFVADIALCPFEMIKVKIQTSPTGTWPTSFIPAARRMYKLRSETRFPFGSLRPLWSRQIPYTMAKFYFFEKTVETFYSRFLTSKPKHEYSKATQLSVTFASGYIAGIICAIVSHPADNIISQIGKNENQGKSLMKIASQLGPINLLTKGLGIRIFMIGTLTGLQWWIYDAFKTSMGMGTTGGGGGINSLPPKKKPISC